ncbi:MAG: phosphogluconate dehydrogenase (NADP(+)-dependent, decarboxylating) [Deltaproteobacteria bacterium RIFOXYD12_FULL_57_12]|nr:MAG: phosphogluconate dehydrogenase (NADP(+)-dependent, decarboxylating) [Deltaproteobacteria bacterium RIFOXYD12_FULL_57_12]
MKKSADIGLIGLGVMGQNLALNMNDHGFTVAVFNRTTDRTNDFMNSMARGTRIIGTHTLAELVGSLKKPRKVMLMIKAGAAVDQTIEQLIPLLEEGDIIIDAGNSFYQDSERWTETLEARGLLFVGCGVSGGEEGARHGPSIMPGGSTAAWPHVRGILQSIAAKVADNTPCCDWVGKGGAGHFVKMVHNGIEYGDMQLICEAYDLLQSGLGMPAAAMSRIFAAWNNGPLNSYLIEITAEILACTENGEATVDKILDAAGQKGTGKWTVNSAMDLGIPLSLIGEAVSARFLSALKEERVQAARILAGPDPTLAVDHATFVADLGEALYAAKIVSYAQSYMLFRAATEQYGWDLNYGGIALMWRGGCIIRAAFLDRIKEAFDQNPELPNLLLAPYFNKQIQAAQPAWRRVVAIAVAAGLPLPAMTSALSFYDGYRRERLPANLLQALRDYFGAHTYERLDQPRNNFFHTDWTGNGGTTASGSYNA